jgi:hypothetical protein
MDERAEIGHGVAAGAAIGIDDIDEPGESEFGPVFVDPILLALLLAMASWPIVGLSLDLSDSPSIGHWIGALGAVLSAGLVGGVVGAPLVRANAVRGALLTLTISWIVASATLPVLPVLVGWNDGGALGFGCYTIIVGTGCHHAVTASGIEGGVWPALDAFWAAPLVEPVPFGALLLGVMYWTRQVRSWVPTDQFAG